MNAQVPAKLRALQSEHGEALWADPQRCRLLLDEAMPAQRREVNVLLAAVTQHAVADLLDARDEQTVLLMLTPSADRIADELAMTPQAARWAVQTWALAMGLVSESALRQRRRQRERAGGKPWSARAWLRVLLLAALAAGLITASARWFQPAMVGLPAVVIPRVVQPARHTVGQVRTLASPEASLRCLATAPDGRTAASGGDGAAWLWDLAGGTHLRRLPVPAGQAVVSVAFGPDGRSLLGGTARGRQSTSRPASAPDGPQGGAIYLWDLADRRLIGRFGPHPEGAWCVAFTPDGRTVLSGGGHGLLRLWDLAGRTRQFVLRGHVGRVLSVAVSEDARLALSTGADRTVRLWDLRSRRAVHVLTAPGPDRPAAAFHGNEARILTCERTGAGACRPCVWALRKPAQADANDAYVRRKICAFHARRGFRWAEAAAFREDASAVALCEEDGLVHLWQIAPQREIARFRAAPPRRVLLGPKKWRVLLAGGGFLRVWHLPRQYVRACIEPKAERVSALAFSQDGRRLIAWDPDGKTEAWEVPGGREKPLEARGVKAFTPPVVSPQEHRLFGAEDGSLHLWDMAGRKEVVRFEGHRGPVTCSTFSADCDLALSGGADGTVRLWDLKALGALARFEGHEGAVTSVALGPNGRFAASAGQDGTLRLWGLPGKAVQAGAKTDP